MSIKEFLVWVLFLAIMALLFVGIGHAQDDSTRLVEQDIQMGQAYLGSLQARFGNLQIELGQVSGMMKIMEQYLAMKQGQLQQMKTRPTYIPPKKPEKKEDNR